MTTDPLQLACPHIATPQEQDRDPNYLSCNADPGQPCVWSARYDGLSDPPFHAERLEAAAAGTDLRDILNPEAFREAVLNTGLV